MALDPSSGSSSGGSGAAAAPAREPEDTACDPARELRMAELRRKYLEGRYSASPHAVSAKIIEDHLADN
jgi:hypothetical protein